MDAFFNIDKDTDAQEISQWVYQEKIKMLYVNHKHSWHASLFVSALIASFSFGSDHYLSALIWWVCFALITLFRMRFTQSCCKNVVRSKNYARCHKYLFWMAMLAGTAWGIGGLVVATPLDEINRIIILLVLVGVCAAAVPLLGILQDVMLAFQLPTVVPYIIWLAYSMEDKTLILAMVLLCYMAGVIVAMRRVEIWIVKGLRIQYRMERMADSLHESNQELQNVNERLEYMTLEDPLTKLYNRRYFEMHLEKEWKQAVRNKTKLTLIVIDVDYFKLYNDTYGHAEGDECLKSIAETLRKSIQRSGDVIARIGGEEFVMLLPDVDEKGAAVVAQMMQSNLEKAAIAHGSSPVNSYVTASIGIASALPNEGATALSLFKAADKALYKAKTKGRNQMEVGELDMVAL